MLASAAQFQLFKPSVPLDFFVQTNPIQSHLCLFHRLHIFTLADNCTSVPATKYHSLTHFPCSPKPLSRSQTLASFTLLHDVPGKHHSHFTAEDTNIKKSTHLIKLRRKRKKKKKICELTLVINRNRVKDKN